MDQMPGRRRSVLWVAELGRSSWAISTPSWRCGAAHFGSLYPFRFRDWTDYTATNEVFGTGNGTQTAFQLIKTYDPQLILLGTAGSFFYVRDITLLASTPVIKINNVADDGLHDFRVGPGDVHDGAGRGGAIDLDRRVRRAGSVRHRSAAGDHERGRSGLHALDPDQGSDRRVLT